MEASAGSRFLAGMGLGIRTRGCRLGGSGDSGRVQGQGRGRGALLDLPSFQDLGGQFRERRELRTGRRRRRGPHGGRGGRRQEPVRLRGRLPDLCVRRSVLWRRSDLAGVAEPLGVVLVHVALADLAVSGGGQLEGEAPQTAAGVEELAAATARQQLGDLGRHVLEDQAADSGLDWGGFGEGVHGQTDLVDVVVGQLQRKRGELFVYGYGQGVSVRPDDSPDVDQIDGLLRIWTDGVVLGEPLQPGLQHLPAGRAGRG